MPAIDNTEIKKLMILLDFDGCTDNAQARERLIARIIQLLNENPHFQTLYIGISSLRQSLLIDFANACLEDDNTIQQFLSCSIVGTEFISNLNTALVEHNILVNVEFVPLLLGDIYHQLPFGTHYQFIRSLNYQEIYASKMLHLEETNNNGELTTLLDLTQHADLAQAVQLTNTSKILILYMHMHYFSNRFTEPVYLLMIDDRLDILNNTQAFYRKNPHLVPASCYFQGMRFVSYDSTIPNDFTSTIRGSGRINLDYEKNIRMLESYSNEVQLQQALIEYGLISENNDYMTPAYNHFGLFQHNGSKSIEMPTTGVEYN